MKLKLQTLFVIAAASVPLSVLAAAHTGAAMAGSTASAPAAAAAAATDMTDAEVRKVDKEGGKLTLKHAAIKNLDMPSMTMVFQVKDKAMLDKLQAGDKVKFKAVDNAGKFTVTEIQSVK